MFIPKTFIEAVLYYIKTWNIKFTDYYFFLYLFILKGTFMGIFFVSNFRCGGEYYYNAKNFKVTVHHFVFENSVLKVGHIWAL